LRGAQETSDFVQETLSAAARQLDRFEYRGIGSLWGYVRRIGLNLIAQAGRRRGLPIDLGYRPVKTPVPVAHELPPLEAMLHSEQLSAIEAALQRLRGAERNAVLLRFEIHRSYKVIARECGYPSAAAARMAIRRALARLAKILAKFAP
jgi:RNA polymerase sigma factor (sigma-70 family)